MWPRLMLISQHELILVSRWTEVLSPLWQSLTGGLSQNIPSNIVCFNLFLGLHGGAH
jgi:hypothetical protein